MITFQMLNNGFRARTSTYMAVMQPIETTIAAIGVYLHLSKACDTTDHDI